MSTTNDLFEKVAVIGAGTMGNGIAQVFASCGSSVTLVDVNEEALERGVAAIGKSLARVVKKERMSQEDADAALARAAVHGQPRPGVEVHGLRARRRHRAPSAAANPPRRLARRSAIVRPNGAHLALLARL